MTDTIKFLLVHPDASLPDGAAVSIKDLRDTILNHPDAFVNAVRGAVQGSGGGAVSGTAATGGPLPMDTPLFKMLPADVARLLSPAAQKLVKADMLALSNNTKSPADLGITVADLQTIQDAFHLSISNELRGQAASGLIKSGISCCCCSPCCCCTAATVIQARRVA